MTFLDKNYFKNNKDKIERVIFNIMSLAITLSLFIGFGVVSMSIIRIKWLVIVLNVIFDLYFLSLNICMIIGIEHKIKKEKQSNQVK